MSQAEPLGRSWPALVLSAAVLAAWGAIPADLAGRQAWAELGPMAYLLVGLGLSTLFGTLGGLLLCVGVFLDTRLARRVGAGPRARSLVWGLLAGALSWSTAHELFAGAGIQRTVWATPGPYVLVAGAVAATALGVLLLQRSLRPEQSRREGLVLLVGAFGLEAAIVWADLHVKVNLYPSFHDALKVVAWVLGCGLIAALLVRARARPLVRAGARPFALAALLFPVLVLLSPGLRERLLVTVPHLWLEPVYLGRAAVQLHAWERVVRRDPRPDAPILRRYGVVPPGRPPQPPPPPPPGARPLAGQDWNLLVVYVDTLRWDACEDPALMPNLSRLAGESLVFANTYASAPITRFSLHTILSGSFDLRSKGPGPLLGVARRRGLASTLFVGEVPHRWLQAQDADFAFDRSRVFRDNDGLDLTRLGWGGTVPIAAEQTEAVDAFLAADPGRFLLWLFYFDVHQWLHYDAEYLGRLQAEHGIDPGLPALERNYRAVVAAWDAQLGRLLQLLERHGQTERTVLLLLADHGEAVSFRGLKGHGPMLWEQCLRVPLILRIPGVGPRRIEALTSLADVTPTLVRLLEPGRDLAGYHGEDLLGQLAASPPPRRYPVAFVGAHAASPERLRFSAVGLVEGRRKLVLQPGSPLPELYDLSAEQPDALNIFQREPETVRRLLERLVASPIYPPPGPPWER